MSVKSCRANSFKFHVLLSTGRPLTKRSQPYPNQYFENVANSPASSKSTTLQFSASHVGSEEEWKTLEREIFSMCLEPFEKNTSSVNNNSKESQTLEPVYSKSSSTRCHQTRNKFCQFCAKNGELRNVVRK